MSTRKDARPTFNKLATNALASSTPDSATFVISDEGVDRDGDRVRQGGLNFKEWEAAGAPWFFGHQEANSGLPIGTSIDPQTGNLAVWRQGNKTLAKVWFDMGDPFARTVASKVGKGLLKSVSIAFVPIDAEKMYNTPGNDFISASVTEVSCVGIPSNPRALLVDTSPAVAKVLKHLFTKGTVQKVRGRFRAFAPNKTTWAEGNSPAEALSNLERFTKHQQMDIEGPGQQPGHRSNNGLACSCPGCTEAGSCPCSPDCLCAGDVEKADDWAGVAPDGQGAYDANTEEILDRYRRPRNPQDPQIADEDNVDPDDATADFQAVNDMLMSRQQPPMMSYDEDREDETHGHNRSKSAKCEGDCSMPDGYPTRQQQMAARYIHAKAEADYLDSLQDGDDPARNADDRQAVGDRMTQIQAAFEGEFPDESWDDALKAFETDGSSTDQMQPGELGMVDAGNIPDEDDLDAPQPIKRVSNVVVNKWNEVVRDLGNRRGEDLRRFMVRDPRE
jgi:hypothetical protein